MLEFVMEHSCIVLIAFLCVVASIYYTVKTIINKIAFVCIAKYTGKSPEEERDFL